MELPIQLKFFKKIELYQEYRFQQRKASGTNLKAWPIEKQILKWTTSNHHHLGSLLTNSDIRNRMIEDKETRELHHAIENLIQRKYGDGDPSVGVIITKEGLLMGEVINDLEGKNLFNKWKYLVFFILVWATALTGALIVIINFIKLIF